MALPINLDVLLHGHSIEWERLEFKKGWNPEEIVHTICAFANDLHNWGGGYIIVGVEEKDGIAVLPPQGLSIASLDKIQKEIVQLAHQLQPNYFPLVQPYKFQEKHILVIWCPAGDNRPYTAPSTQGKGAQRHYYVRQTSNSIIAKGDQLRQLQELTARIPFDDRIHHTAKLTDLNLGLIQAYLNEIGSELFNESTSLSFSELCLRMQIAKGPEEFLRPTNVGLLFFSKNPENFMNRSWIELVIREDEDGKQFQEKYFKGSLNRQLTNALAYLNTYVIKESVTKIKGKAEAQRVYNYPFDAIEEALANAIYHKGYELAKPIEIQVHVDRIEILSFPGPVPPVNAQILKENKNIVARDYRNRRIGDFLKELHLTEGRGTGFPTIRNAMQLNGSPEPIFETDEQSTYFLTVLHINPLFVTSNTKISFNNISELSHFIDQLNDQANDQAKPNDNSIPQDITIQISQLSDQANDQALAVVNTEVHEKVIATLKAVQRPIKRVELMEKLGLSNHSTNRAKYLDPLLKLGWITMTIPNTPTHQDQQYILTLKGQILLAIIGNDK
ncbi:RNA-binding domain-containing protein [Aequorivita antarctica]|uniref:Transcriptional regulator n=1 Tax=Aequorivita antarctica TaxID=153266 RepID=A0A5C6Z242_9FLAO|nr:RNA-binding domain-containing protein [Aequorivita antarctica]TXD73573.1 transcriptional regulator [Aequorivita antarctica]SRX75012.1 hypothetical protein AEQU3_01999 [Aequorivita antarctica]